MDNIIPQFYRNYGKYINANRAFPLSIDGLKPVERRVLLSAYQIARDKFAKSARIDGHVIGHYHPHGTCYGSLVQLVRQGFLDGQGNFGCNLGVDTSPPAAMRYTECKISKFTIDLAFQLIKYVPWEEGELDNEPLYLPTKFPFCLLGQEPTQRIGFGYKTYIPCDTLEDLTKRLFWLLKITKEEPVIKPITGCKILSGDDELKQLLTTGKATLEVQGITKVINANYKIIIKSWPPGKRFETILNKLSKEMENQDIGFQDLSSGENSTHIVFEVLKQRNKETIFRKCIPKIQEALKGKINYDTILVTPDDDIQLTPIDDMLLSTYGNYLKVNEHMLDTEYKRLMNVMKEYLVLEKIKPHLPSYLNAAISNVDDTIRELSEVSSQPYEIVKDLMTKYNIRKLLSLKIDIKSLEDEMNQAEYYKKNLEKFVLKKYGGK